MNVKDYMKTVAESDPLEWIIIFRPTFLHRFTPIVIGEDERVRFDADEHIAVFSYRPDISITIAYGLVDVGAYSLPDGHPFANENARTSYLDCFHDSQLIHREVVISVDRQRCILPLPPVWSSSGEDIPETKNNLVKLIHTLAGPPTDYDAYFKQAGMKVSKEAWP